MQKGACRREGGTLQRVTTGPGRGGRTPLCKGSAWRQHVGGRALLDGWERRESDWLHDQGHVTLDSLCFRFLVGGKQTPLYLPQGPGRWGGARWALSGASRAPGISTGARSRRPWAGALRSRGVAQKEGCHRAPCVTNAVSPLWILRTTAVSLADRGTCPVLELRRLRPP